MHLAVCLPSKNAFDSSGKSVKVIAYFYRDMIQSEINKIPEADRKSAYGGYNYGMYLGLRNELSKIEDIISLLE